jgi:hypothetical protein
MRRSCCSSACYSCFLLPQWDAQGVFASNSVPGEVSRLNVHGLQDQHHASGRNFDKDEELPQGQRPAKEAVHTDDARP